MSDPFTDPDLRACADLVAEGDPERLASVMAAPVAARAVLFPLYAFNLELGRSAWASEEPMIGEMRLQWWRDVLGDIAAGKAPRKHHVATPLARLLDREGAARLDAMVEARRWDLYKDPHEDEAALERYLSDTGGALMFVCARALGDQDGRAAEALGFATGMANYLRAVPALEGRGRIPLVDGRPEAVAALARAGLERVTAARKTRGAVSGQGGSALLAGALTAPLLRMAVSEPGRVAEGLLTLSEASMRARRLWSSLSGRW